jgi:hypothetical protein
MEAIQSRPTNGGTPRETIIMGDFNRHDPYGEALISAKPGREKQMASSK